LEGKFHEGLVKDGRNLIPRPVVARRGGRNRILEDQFGSLLAGCIEF
jgi:hypothetical protein